MHYFFTWPDDQATMKDELAQMINYIHKDDNNQPESNEEEPLSFTLELGGVDLQV